MTDPEFFAAVEHGALSNQAFRHREHLRLSWLHLQRAPYDEAVRMMKQSIRRFAAHHGAPDRYHHTITVFWMRLVAVAAARDNHATFDNFIAANADLLDKNSLSQFYSPHRLSSSPAREGWLDPDLRPLPR